MDTPRMIDEEHGTSTGFRHPHDGHRAGDFARLVAEPRTDRVDLPQYSLARVLGTWAAAALPMAVVAWVVAPLVAGTLEGTDALPRVLIVGLGAGMVWQFALVLILVWREQRSLGWSVLQRALWLQAPQSPRTGRRGGRLWLLVIPLVVLLAAKESLPSVPAPAARDFGRFLGSAAGQQFLSGNWLWLALIVTMFVFNTVLGEELFFRGLLLPRMHGVFGRWDWAANGILFAAYHLHVPWAIPQAIFDAFLMAYPSRRYRSALLGIAVHSAQSVVLGILVLIVVLQ